MLRVVPLPQECMDSSCPQKTSERVWNPFCVVLGMCRPKLPVGDQKSGTKLCPCHPGSMQELLCLHISYQVGYSQHTVRKKAANIQTKSSPSTPEKMAGQKDWRSPPLAKTPKSQLTVEQLLTKKDWNLPNKILHPKTKTRPQQNGRMSTFTT